MLDLNGELDSRGTIQLDKTLKELVQARHYWVVLDISAIRFLGNQTLSVLLSHLKECRAGGGDIKILSPQRNVLHYLKSNPMFELFEMYSSRTEAIASFPAGPPPVNVDSSATPSPPAKPPSPPENPEAIETRFATGEILYGNSCMLVTLIKSLEQKGILTSEEASSLIHTDIHAKGEME